jgi:hypothetical protein
VTSTHDIRAAIRLRSITQELWDALRASVGAAGLQLDEMDAVARERLHAKVLALPLHARKGAAKQERNDQTEID